MAARYLVCENYIREPDGKYHFKSFEDLVALYGVDPEDCIDITTLREPPDLRLIVLKAKYNGDYTLPTTAWWTPPSEE